MQDGVPAGVDDGVDVDDGVVVGDLVIVCVTVSVRVRAVLADVAGATVTVSVTGVAGAAGLDVVEVAVLPEQPARAVTAASTTSGPQVGLTRLS